MANENNALLAYVYTGLLAPGVIVGDPTPMLAFQAESFPTEILLPVNFGVVGFNGVDGYSIEFKVTFDGQDVSISTVDGKLMKHHPLWGDNGEYVADMSVFEKFKAISAGYYCLEARLLFKSASKEQDWEVIDIKKSHFAVSKAWENKFHG
ncbi:hypothetical protein [uncultured Enterobacter sp.]|uniref:hypothetical protein n=1 Tax=uncultured Enterobacter sp. TaxID=238202 RepID=UPI002582D8F4|nr:hypothetical protein [uncultured Enterobacter sp.]